MNSKVGLTRIVSVLTLLVFVVGLVGACAGPAPTPGKPTQAPKAETPKSEAPKAEIPKAEVPAAPKKEPGKPRTIGIVVNNIAAESMRRLAQGGEEAAKALGWTPRVVDIKGDLTQLPFVIDNFLEQKVDGILLFAVHAELLEASARKANAAKVPLVTAWGSGVSDTLLAAHAPDWYTQGSMVGRFMLDALGYKGNIVLYTVKFAPNLVQREEGLKGQVKYYPGIKFIAEPQIDFANFVDDTRKTMENILLANPKGSVSAVVTTGDAFLIGPRAAVEAAGRNEIKFFGMEADALALASIRKGVQVQTLLGPLEMAAWQGVDTLNDYFAGKTVQRFSPAMESELVTKDNVRAAGKEYEGKDPDFRAKFKKKWGL